MGISLSPEERFEVFGEQDPAQYDAEVSQRWGDTDAYAQSQRRTAAYSKEDWLRIRAEAEDLEARFAAALAGGVPADAQQAMDLAEEHRQQITGTYYDCLRRCTPRWAGCTSRTSGSRRTTTSGHPGWRST